MAGKAVERFRAAAGALGVQVEVRTFPQGTRTAQDAARAVGCAVGQIVKSLVFMADGEPVIALTSGSNRADPGRLATLVAAREVRQATAAEVRAATGFAIGGIPPFGHAAAHKTLVDRDLMAFDVVWSAAGSPDTTFPIAPGELIAASGGTVAEFGCPS